MSTNLKVSMLKLASSKKTWRMKVSYYFKGLIFYPFLMSDMRNSVSKNGKSLPANLEGDDVYPLF
jgi:hypothetical protein